MKMVIISMLTARYFQQYGGSVCEWIIKLLRAEQRSCLWLVDKVTSRRVNDCRVALTQSIAIEVIVVGAVNRKGEAHEIINASHLIVIGYR